MVTVNVWPGSAEPGDSYQMYGVGGSAGAVGTPGSHLFLGLVIQAVLIALGAAIVGILVEIPMAGTSQMAVRLAPSDYLAVPVVAVIIGVVASVPPARRAAHVDPAIAFGGGK